jgi:hypothetical protein
MFQRLLASFLVIRTNERDDRRPFSRLMGFEKLIGRWISQGIK